MLAAIFSLLVAMASIQGGASLAKSIFPSLGPYGATTLRLGLAALILLALRRPWRSRVPRGAQRYIFAYGASLGLMNLLFYLALARIPLGIAVALEFIGPLSIALLASRRPLDFLWALLAIGGIVLVLPISTNGSSLDPVGILLAVLAGLSWGLYIVFGKKSASLVSSEQAASWGMLVAALVAVPPGLYFAGAQVFNPAYLPVGLAIAVFSSALPYSLEMVALKKIEAKTFGILMSLEPGMAAVSGLLFLQERLDVRQWLALLLIVAASVGTSIASAPRRPVAGEQIPS